MENFWRKIAEYIPNFVTLAALASGLTSIRLSQGAQFDWAAFAILLAAILDFADGIVARSLNVESSLGAELDSLADLVSFGVAPAFLVYNSALYQFGEFGWVITAIYVLATGYRLARFNANSKLEEALEQDGQFQGVPSTASALFMISASQLADRTLTSLSNPVAMAIVTLLASFLMVSSISVPKLSELLRRNNKR